MERGQAKEGTRAGFVDVGVLLPRKQDSVQLGERAPNFLALPKAPSVLRQAGVFPALAPSHSALPPPFRLLSPSSAPSPF